MSNLEELAAHGFFVRLLGKRLGGLRKNQLLNAKEKIQAGQMNTWAYPWAFSRHVQSGIACVPSVSLIQNIGFGQDSTHTTGLDIDCVKRGEVSFPIKINSVVIPDENYDLLFVGHASFLKRILRKLVGRISK